MPLQKQRHFKTLIADYLTFMRLTNKKSVNLSTLLKK